VDFAANKQMTLPNAKGCALVGVDTMGGASSSFLAGVPIVFGNTTTPGCVIGENLHTLTRTETPTGITSSGAGLSVTVTSSNNDFVRLNGNGFATGIGSGGAAVAFNGIPASATVTSSGTTAGQSVTSNNTSGGAHNNVERSMGVFWNLAL